MGLRYVPVQKIKFGHSPSCSQTYRYEHIPLMQKPIDRQVLIHLFNLVGDADDATNTEREAQSSIARTTSKIGRL